MRRLLLSVCAMCCLLLTASIAHANSAGLPIAAPSISGLSPSSVPAYSAFTLTVNGSNFEVGSQVRLGLGTMLATTYVSSTEITAYVPISVNWYRSSYPNVYPIAVINPGGFVSNTSILTITNPVITISSISPTTVPVYSAFTLTVNGTGFVSGSQISLNGAALNTTWVSSTQLTAAVPLSVNWFRSFYPNAYPVLVTNPDGSVTNTATLTTIEPTPSIAKVSPATVANGTGFNISVTGSGFVPGAAIHWNGTGITTTFVSATQLTASVSASQNRGYTVYPQSAVVTVDNPDDTGSNAVNVSVTGANYTLNVTNGSGGGSYAPGAVVTIVANTPPVGENFFNWTGATVADANGATTTIVMPVGGANVTANYATPSAGIPFPVSGHPRLWMTQADASRLQAWAVSTNPAWQQGMQPLLANAMTVYNTYFFPGGSAAVPYPDNGSVGGADWSTIPGVGWTNFDSEEWGAILAFGSLVDPNSSNRIADAQAARNLLMYAMNLAAQGPNSGQPFQDPAFAISSRAYYYGTDWPLIVDWIYNATDGSGNPILTASDKATIQKVFMQWCGECEFTYSYNIDHPIPTGVVNSASLLPGGLPNREASDKTYLSHMPFLTMMALCIDPSDDPAVAQPATQIGNSLRSYITDATGAWLYQLYAMMGEPADIVADYGIPNNPTGAGFGIASGGLPVAGITTLQSPTFILQTLLALQTSGFNNVAYSGPQIKLIGDPVWNRFVNGCLSSLLPEPYTGVYQFACYGDLNNEYVSSNAAIPFALLDFLNNENGISNNDNAVRWIVENALPGGQADVTSNILNPYSAGGADQSILYFMALDPSASAPADPRPSLPTYFIDPAINRIVAHSDWTPNGTIFDYTASWESLVGQDGDGGGFEFFRNGEWLTKEMSNADWECVGLCSYYHNAMGLQNWSENGDGYYNIQWWEWGMWDTGSQWFWGSNAGDPVSVNSFGPGYVYSSSDLTNLYNHGAQPATIYTANDITQATRSIVWLNNDYIVVYDRAASQHTGLFKEFNLSLVTSPAITGNTAVETMVDGQQLFVQSLLPANAAITSREGDKDFSGPAYLEPTKYVLTSQDPTNPVTTRLLNVLQGANAGASMVPASYLQSSRGSAFDGALFGSNVVYFPVNSPEAFTETIFPAPAGVTTFIVTGLSANTSYGVNLNGTSVTVTPGGAGYTSDSAGLLQVTL